MIQIYFDIIQMNSILFQDSYLQFKYLKIIIIIEMTNRIKHHLNMLRFIIEMERFLKNKKRKQQFYV